MQWMLWDTGTTLCESDLPISHLFVTQFPLRCTIPPKLAFAAFAGHGRYLHLTLETRRAAGRFESWTPPEQREPYSLTAGIYVDTQETT
jgi:hypothetical protein